MTSVSGFILLIAELETSKCGSRGMGAVVKWRGDESIFNRSCLEMSF